jgi:ferredoxin
MISACLIIQNNYYMQFAVTIEKCTGCGTCTDVCPTEAIRIENGKARIDMECIDCGACPRACPEGAIRMQKSPAPAFTK